MASKRSHLMAKMALKSSESTDANTNKTLRPATKPATNKTMNENKSYAKPAVLPLLPEGRGFKQKVGTWLQRSHTLVCRKLDFAQSQSTRENAVSPKSSLQERQASEQCQTMTPQTQPSSTLVCVKERATMPSQTLSHPGPRQAVNKLPKKGSPTEVQESFLPQTPESQPASPVNERTMESENLLQSQSQPSPQQPFINVPQRDSPKEGVTFGTSFPQTPESQPTSPLVSTKEITMESENPSLLQSDPSPQQHLPNLPKRSSPNFPETLEFQPALPLATVNERTENLLPIQSQLSLNTVTLTDFAQNAVVEVVDSWEDLNDVTDANILEIQSHDVDREDFDQDIHQVGEAERLPQEPPTTPNHTSRKRARSASQSQSPVRKRARNPALWKKNIRKDLKNKGLAHTSSTGKEVQAVEMRPPCYCKKECRHRLPEEDRQRVHKTFWDLGNHERQWEFIRQNSTNEHNDDRNKKKNKRSYFFKVGNVKVTVCKQMYMSTLAIWDCWIDSAWKHVNPDKGFTTTPDKRGRHSEHFKAVTPDKVKTIKDHVLLFPRVPSHYCRATSQREYLENGLSLAKMSKLYIEWAAAQGLPKDHIATRRQYRDVVNSNFNIGFYKPKKDQCGLCCLIRSKHNSKEVREQHKDRYVTHIKRKDLVKKIKNKDRAEAAKDKTIAVVSFDLQKQLTCPKSEVGELYYMNKLTVYNFTVFHEIERMGTCYLWHEGLGKKGSCEISSSIFLCIQNLVDRGVKEIRFYSDNCAGQNKNRFVFAMYQHAAVLHSIKIVHRFLEPGHTHMDADTIHARIENASKSMNLWDFDDWVKTIEEAKEELPKYQVVKLDQKLIVSYKPLVASQNWSRDLHGQQINWTKVREISVDGKEGNLMRLKYDLDGEIITLSPNNVGRPVNLKKYKPPEEYSGFVPLIENKRRDLQKMCDRFIIPVNKQQFIKAVLEGTVDGVNGGEEAEYESDEELIAGLCGKEKDDVNHRGEEDDGKETDSDEED